MSDSTPAKDSLEELFEQAEDFFYSGERQKAIALYNQILHVRPDFVPALVQRGLARHEEGEIEEALADHEAALAIDPSYGPAYYGRGWARGAQGDYEGELADARRGMELEPEHASWYYRRVGHAFAGLGERQKAIEIYSRAIEIRPDDQGTIYNRAICYTEMGENDRALADFDRALELAPRWSMAFCQRGYLHLRMGQYRAALDDFNQAIQHRPSMALAYEGRGRAHEKLHMHGQAIKDFARAAELDPALRRAPAPPARPSQAPSARGGGRAELLTPTLQAVSPPAREGKLPWKLTSQVWIALLGGTLPLTAIAFLNGKRLGMERKQLRLILALGGGAFLVTLVITGVLLELDGFSRGSLTRLIRYANRGVAFLLYLILHRLQDSPNRVYAFSNGEYGSLWKAGLLAIITFGGLEVLGLILVILLGLWLF